MVIKSIFTGTAIINLLLNDRDRRGNLSTEISALSCAWESQLHTPQSVTGAPNLCMQLMPLLDLNSDEWHADETVIKINDEKHYVWFIIDSETRFMLGFHLSPYRSLPQAHSLFSHVAHSGNPPAIVSDRCNAYRVPVKCYFPNVKHIRVESFQDDISNNLIEFINNRFKPWYKTKRGFHSFESANATISVFVFFFKFIRSHQGLNGLTPAQVAGASYGPNPRNLFSLANPR